MRPSRGLLACNRLVLSQPADEIHSLASLAAVAAGVPYEAGVIRRTKQSVAASLRRARDDDDDVEAVAKDKEGAVKEQLEAPEGADGPVWVHPSFWSESATTLTAAAS